MTKKKRAALYLRVSTNEQNTENQRLTLQKVADAKGYEIVNLYEDKGFSGTLDKDQRPALKKMIQAATAREFDVLMVWSVDRLGRSTGHVASLMEELNKLEVSQYYHMQSVDTSTPYGKAMIEMAAVFASLEKAVIVERVNAGLARAKAEGKTLGRPKSVTEDKAKAILAARQKGGSVRKIAEQVGVSVGAVHSTIKAAGG